MTNKSKPEPKGTLPNQRKPSSVFNWVVSVILLAAGVLSASYLTTETFDFGGQMTKLRSIYAKYSPNVQDFLIAREREFLQPANSHNMMDQILASLYILLSSIF